jgi:two-component system, OmpR family, phosphate regulon response regulator PhoB
MLPDGNGLDLCREIKNSENPVTHPIFMMSAALPLEKMVGRNGADAMISKPFKLDFVLNTIKCYMSPN